MNFHYFYNCFMIFKSVINAKKYDLNKTKMIYRGYILKQNLGLNFRNGFGHLNKFLSW